MSKQKLLPDYLNEYSEGFSEVCKRLDLILDAIYGEEADKQIKKEKWTLWRGKNNADNQPTTETKKRGRKSEK